MLPHLKINAIVSGRAVAWELIEETEPELLPLVPEWDWGSDFIETPPRVVLTLIARRAA